jgi:hypothetical protein
MILRCTAKVLSLIGAKPAMLEEAPPSDDDWYLNLLWIDRRKCLLLTHAGTLFPVLVAEVKKSDITPIGPYVARLIEAHLASEQFAADTLGHVEAGDVHIARTTKRSVLGFMSDAATHARYRVAAMGGIARADVGFLNRYTSHVAQPRRRLRHSTRPCRATKVCVLRVYP